MALATVTKTRQRKIAILSTLALGLGLLGLSFQIPAAANLPNSTFDAGDGNETVDAGTPAETDWFSPAPGLVTKDDLASGAADDSLSGDEDGTSPTITLGSVQGNKADLTKIRIAHERVAATGLDFLYLAWNRPADPSGNVDFDFELNKLAQPSVPAAGGTWNLNRSAGDILLTFELVGGGTNPILSLRKWVASGNKSLCDSNPSTPCWGPPLLLTPLTTPAAEGSVNPGTDITFGEMAINLGLAGIFTPGQCTSFASVYAKTRSSGSGFNSQISDLVAPVTKQISNCGSITVTKTVAGPTIAGDQTSFGFSVTCGATVDLDPITAGIQTTKTFSLLHGQSLKLSDIPVGSNCTVTETAPTPASHWTVTHNGTATSSANQAAVNSVSLAGLSVTFTNTRNSGAMAVSKTSTGGTGTFLFSVDCNDGTDHDRTGADRISISTVTAGTAVTSAAITGIPTGTLCTVTEETHTRFDPTTPTPSTGQVTIDADTTTTQTVSYTNVRKTATLTVDKLTSGGTGTFLFAVDCNDGTVHDRTGTDKLSITNTDTATVTGIPTGTSCTVTEDDNALFNSSLRSPSTSNTVAIADGGSTIYFQNTRKTGTLTVSKSRTGGSATDVFTFEVDCTNDTFDRKGVQALTITGSGSATVTGIPTGTSCVVTETTDSRYISTRTPSNGTVILDENGETVSFSNVRNTGTLTISKTTTGGSGTFTFTVDCDDDAFDTTRTITDTNSATVTGIPTGTTCTVTETIDPLFASTRSPLNGQRTIDIDGETVSFENVRRVGALKIAKVTEGGTGTFTFVVDCSDNRFDRTGLNNTTKVTITDSGEVTIGGIPTGTTCSVTEDDNALFTSTVTSAGNSVTIAENTQTVSFRNVRKTGSLIVSKTTTGGTGTFKFAVDCSGDSFDRGVGNELTIVNSGTARIDGIPTGTTCTVSENGDPLFTSSLTSATATVTIDTDGETVSFSNVRKVGDLTVTKTTTGGTGTFRFAVDCTDDRFDRVGADRLTIVGSGSATVTGIPTTVVCTVTETDDSLFTSTRTPLNGQVTMDADGETVVFTNVRNTGTLTISKSTIGGDGTFRFAVDCSDDRFDRSGVDVLTTSGSGTGAPITAIPTQTSCTVTETVPAGWAAVGATSKTVVIVGQETASFSNRKLPSGIAIAKVASAPTVHSGDKVTYTYTVTNIGENPLTSVLVVDDKCTPVVFGAGDIDGDKVLDLTEAWTFTCISSLTGTTTNIATATGTDPHGATPTANATATVTVIKPAIAVDKTPSATSVAPGTTVVYTYTVTNPGDVPLSAVTVSDDKCSPVTFVRGDVNVDKLLQVGETWVFQCSQVQTGRIDTLTNVGTATGVDTLGLKVTGTDTVSISVVAPSVIFRPAPEVVTAPAVVAAPATLPRTGSDAKGLLQLAGSLILLGLALMLTADPMSRMSRLRRR